MKKQELLKIMDAQLLEKLFGFCYARTSDSQEAQELCSDIVFELVKASNTEGDMGNPYGFLWRIARNTYADFSDKKRRRADMDYEGDPEEVFPFIASPEDEDDSQELLGAVYRQIAFLTRVYREVMVLFYLDGLSVGEIARLQGTSEGAIRQRLFSARKRIQSEVKEMAEIDSKPVVLGKIEYNIWGTGSPAWGDPQDVCTRQFSKHLVWMCRKKAVSAAEAAAELHVPTVYVEEELEILRKGANGEYGMLRQLDNGKYAINFLLFDTEEINKLREVYAEQAPAVCRSIADYVKEHQEEYLAFPYLNRKKDWNLILWQQVVWMVNGFQDCVSDILAGKYFAQVKKAERPFSIFGYVEDGKRCGSGWDGVSGKNVCGCARVHVDNIYNQWIQKHFSCGHDLANDSLLQMAIRAVDGLAVDSLSEAETEHAAKAIECGYLYREGDMLYTKILVSGWENRDRIFDISDRLCKEYLKGSAEAVAEKLSGLIRRFVPEHLLGEWQFANSLAGMVLFDSLVAYLIEMKVMTPPENGLGAEGCWLSLQK